MGHFLQKYLLEMRMVRVLPLIYRFIYVPMRKPSYCRITCMCQAVRLLCVSAKLTEFDDCNLPIWRQNVESIVSTLQ
jgi:hypothetical protein